MSSSNFEPLDNSQAASMDDIFGVQKIDLESAQDEFAGKEPDLKAIFPEVKAETKVEEKPKPVFQPKLTKAQQEKQHEKVETAPAKVKEPGEDVEIPEDKVTPEMLKAMESTILKLLSGQNGVKIGKAPAKPVQLDFSKLSENDVYDLDVPIPVIDHGVPDYLNVELKDKNYAARWVHKTPRRLGPMKAMGWTPVVEEDIENLDSLKDTKDESGFFRYDDVILMRIPKQKLFGLLRRNYERTRQQVSSAKLKAGVTEALTKAPAGGSNKKTAAEYMQHNQLEVYIPGDK